MIPAIFLVLCAVAYRIATGLLIHSGSTWLSNFAPFAALALCSAAYFPARLKFVVPFAALLISDVVINAAYHAPIIDGIILCRYLALAVVGLIGLAFQRRRSLATMIPASIIGSTVFYFITNLFSWISDPGYAKNFAGLIQSLTVGLSQYSSTPTWMFFRNSLVSDLIFTAAFVLCMSFGQSSADAHARVTTPRTA